MSVYCVSGANRGLGLEFVHQLATQKDNIIIATVRNTTTDLADLKSVASSNTYISICNSSSTDSIRTFAEEVAKILNGLGRKIDFLLNVAGVNHAPHLNSLSMDPDALETNMRTNVLGPAKTVEFLLQKKVLSADVRVLNMASGLGSMATSALIKPRKWIGYSISKAGVNMLTIHQAEDLREELPGAIVVAVDPGWVKTRMGGDRALLEPFDSIHGMLKVLHGLTEEDNGKFLSYDGREKSW